MAIAKVQDTGIQTSAGVSSDSAALGTVTAGNLLVVGAGIWLASGPSITSIADGIGNTFSQAVLSGQFQNRAHAAIWYKENCAGGASTVTLTYGASGHYAAWAAAEFSGVATSSSLDQTASNTASNTSTDANVTSGATTQADELVVAAASVAIDGDSNVGWGASASTGYTNIAQYPNWGGIETLSLDYKVVSATGAQSATWSHDDAVGGSNNGWGAVIATFKAAGGGSQSITGGLFSNSPTFHAATVGRGAVTISGSLVSTVATFYGGTVSASYPITAALFSDGDSFYGATVAPGTVTVSGGLFTDADSFHAATVGRGAVTVSGALFSDSDTFYAASVSSAGSPQTITSALFANDNAFFTAQVGGRRLGWDDGGRRRPVFVYEESPPEPVKTRKRVKVRRKAVEAAIEVPWAGDWTLAQALGAVPQTVPVAFTPPLSMPRSEVGAVAVALWLRREGERRVREAQEDEIAIELLLLAVA